MHKKRNAWCVVMILFVTAFDRVTKILASKYLAAGSSVVFIKGIVVFNYAENVGAAFSMFSGARWLLVAVTALALAGIFWYIFSNRCKHLPYFWSLALIGAGGLGNLIDRVFYGYVVDFIEPVFIRFATFNIADCAVTLGACAFVVSMLVQCFKKEDKHE